MAVADQAEDYQSATVPSEIHRFPSGCPAGRTSSGVRRFLQIVDLSDPSDPKEVGRWWVPGQHSAGGEEPNWTPATGIASQPGERNVCFHHGLPRGDRLYCGWGDAGLVILDIANPAHPILVSQLDLGASSSETHTALPLPTRSTLVVTDESVTPKVHMRKDARVVDIADEKHPRVITTFPVPASDFPERGIRFGPHNVHEPRPGSLIDPDMVYLTYFAGGLRAIDVSNPAHPADEVAYIVPAEPGGTRHGGSAATRGVVQINDVYVAGNGLIYMAERHGGGLYIVEHSR